jgi:CRP-like cAMP-binding protein
LTPPNHKGNLCRLASFSLLSSLNDKTIENFEKTCSWVEYGASEVIIERGSANSNVYFIITGTVHVLNYSRSGRAITYAALKEGDLFGELAAIDGLPRSAWVCTITPCLVGTAPGPAFVELVANSSKMALALLRRLSNNIRLSDERLTDVSLLGAEQRACMELIRMSQPDLESSGGYLVSPMLTQVNFANLIGVSRETVSRLFRKLIEESMIIRDKRGLYIPNREKLEQRAFM